VGGGSKQQKQEKQQRNVNPNEQHRKIKAEVKRKQGKTRQRIWRKAERKASLVKFPHTHTYELSCTADGGGWGKWGGGVENVLKQPLHCFINSVRKMCAFQHPIPPRFPHPDNILWPLF